MMQKNIYSYTLVGKKYYYKLIRKFNDGNCIWMPMKKFLWFYIRDYNKELFISDSLGFVEEKRK